MEVAVENEKNENCSDVKSYDATVKPKEKNSIEDVVNKVAERPSMLYILMMLGLMSFRMV